MLIHFIWKSHGHGLVPRLHLLKRRRQECHRCQSSNSELWRQPIGTSLQASLREGEPHSSHIPQLTSLFEISTSPQPPLTAFQHRWRLQEWTLSSLPHNRNLWCCAMESGCSKSWGLWRTFWSSSVHLHTATLDPNGAALTRGASHLSIYELHLGHSRPYQSSYSLMNN